MNEVAMTLAEAGKLLEQHAIKFRLAQSVDIHGSAR
jgi:hypothetical protein